MSDAEAREKLQKLAQHYKLPENQTLLEWESAARIIRRINPASAEANMQTSLKKLTPAAHPNLSWLVTIGLTIPTTSVDCERGISAYNLIKTDHRSCMKIENVDNQVVIFLNGPPLKEFDFNSAMKNWFLKKNGDRRGFTKMLKK